MPAVLHTDVVGLSRSQLDARFQRAIEQAEAAQREGRAAWQSRGDCAVLPLESGASFVPDGQDAKLGMAGMIGGGIAGLFGVAFVGVAFDPSQAEPWMRYAGPALVALGGHVAWSSRAKNRAAKARPRFTGAYLFDDVLLHVSTLGCRTFPIERVRGFEYRQRSENRWSLLIQYVGDDGAAHEDVLFGRDAAVILEEWRANYGAGFATSSARA
jgi:hypothetical protein